MAQQIARVALEMWRASGARTEARLAALVEAVGASYHGPAASWSAEVRTLIAEAQTVAAQSTRTWELHP